MKLKHRLSLYAVVIFSVIILVASTIIYISFHSRMERNEQQKLENKTLLAAIFYLEKDELPLLEHENIRSQLQKAISRRNIILFDRNNKQFDGQMPADSVVDKGFIEEVRREGDGFRSSADYFYQGVFYRDNQGDFVVITREPKSEFNANMQSLLQILVTVSIVGLLLIYLFSLYLGNVAYAPITKIIDQIKERDSKNFTNPLVLQKSYAEVDDLVRTYNHFVERLAQTFNVQKNFIDYVSHELRTPITALLGTLEVTDQKKRTVEEYGAVTAQLKQYTNDLQETLDRMMLLSGAKTSFEFRSIRIDEVVWKVIENAIVYHQAKIEVDIRVSDTGRLLWEADEKLLELAFNNIIENAIKYSDNKPIKVELYVLQDRLVIGVQDNGIGIPNADLSHVKENFVRGHNTQHYQGKGIGLSMANVIFKLHHIQLDLSSDTNGTRVCLTF